MGWISPQCTLWGSRSDVELWLPTQLYPPKRINHNESQFALTCSPLRSLCMGLAHHPHDFPRVPREIDCRLQLAVDCYFWNTTWWMALHVLFHGHFDAVKIINVKYPTWGFVVPQVSNTHFVADFEHFPHQMVSFHCYYPWKVLCNDNSSK